MPRCRILLFAHLAEALGQDTLDLDLPGHPVAADAVTSLRSAHPALAPHLDAIALALDERYVEPDAPLHEGCTLALIPPVSGG